MSEDMVGFSSNEIVKEAIFLSFRSNSKPPLISIFTFMLISDDGGDKTTRLPLCCKNNIFGV